MTRSVLVIGASHGNIGRAIADRCVRTERWSRVWSVNEREMDVTDSFGIREFLDEHGPFEDTVYCAGRADLTMLGSLDLNDVKDIYDVNVLGFIRFVNAIVLRQSAGRILAITSDAATKPMRGSMAYCTSKAALDMAIRVAARELAPNWQVNGLAPAIVADTPMTEYIDSTVPAFRGWSEERASEYEQSQIPMGRRCTKDEVAAMALHILLGPSFLTGSIVNLTGGKL